jgi:hypothetical protein
MMTIGGGRGNANAVTLIFIQQRTISQLSAPDLAGWILSLPLQELSPHVYKSPKHGETELEIDVLNRHSIQSNNATCSPPLKTNRHSSTIGINALS